MCPFFPGSTFRPHSNPIPPITDVFGHISFALTPTSSADHFYVQKFGATYRTFHFLVSFLEWTFGPSLHRICSIIMLLISALFFSIPALYLYLRSPRSLPILGALAGPGFLMMHSLIFVWGAFPFIFAAWFATLAALVILRADDAILHALHEPRWITVSCLFFFLALYSHPMGFFYLALVLVFIWSRLIINRRRLLPRLAFREFRLCSG